MPYCTIQNKSFYYQEFGQGRPLLFLHGNTASSNMFLEILPFYKDYHCILPDFLGNGKSQRLIEFPLHYWYDQALQIIEFMEQLCLNDCILIGTSGGAITAMNVVLERPDLCHCVIADSFMGEKMDAMLFPGFEEERHASLLDDVSKAFYQDNQGDDYELVVHQDTNMIVRHVAANIRCVHKDVKDLIIPTLLLGSKQDDMIPNIQTYYEDMCQRSSYLQMHIFTQGDHPSLCSNAKQSADVILKLIEIINH